VTPVHVSQNRSHGVATWSDRIFKQISEYHCACWWQLLVFSGTTASLEASLGGVGLARCSNLKAAASKIQDFSNLLCLPNTSFSAQSQYTHCCAPFH
jgi:hypothetical protein